MIEVRVTSNSHWYRVEVSYGCDEWMVIAEPQGGYFATEKEACVAASDYYQKYGGSWHIAGWMHTDIDCTTSFQPWSHAEEQRRKKRTGAL